MAKLMKKNWIEKLIFISIMLLLIGLPSIILFCYTFQYDPFNQINRVHILWYCLPILFVLYILDIIFNKKKINYIDISIYLLIVLGVISTILAVDVDTSIYGEYTRNEGLLSLLAYYFIILNLKNLSNEKYKKNIIKTMIILGVINIIYGIFQVYTLMPFITRFQIPYMSSGLIGNANFLGSYMVILASFMFALYMLEKRIDYLALSVVFFMGICLCSSTGPFISFLLMVIFFIIFYRKKINWKSLLKVLSLFIVVYFFVDFTVRYVHTKMFQNEINPSYNISSELKNLSLSNLGNGRIQLWKESFPLVEKYWVFGAGLDNFGKVYGIKNGMYYDKAHNVYLQILITNGIFALIIYMVLMGIIFFKGLKIKENMYIALLMAFIGYSIQAFSNINVIEVAPTFYVVCGLLLGKIQKEKLKVD